MFKNILLRLFWVIILILFIGGGMFTLLIILGADKTEKVMDYLVDKLK